jgi:hypothetical protein
MFTRKFSPAAVVFIALLAAAQAGWAAGVILSQTKEQLQLQYDVVVSESIGGRVSVTFTLADEGRLKPITGVYLYIPAEKAEKDGGRYADLFVPVAMKTVAGKQVVNFEVTKGWARRAEIQLITLTLDGKQGVPGQRTQPSYLYSIPLAKYVDNIQPPDNQMP